MKTLGLWMAVGALVAMMPSRGGSRISDEEVRMVAAYVWTLGRTDS